MALATAVALALLARPPIVAHLLARLPVIGGLASPRLGLVAGFGLAYLGACGLEHLRRGDLPGGRRGEMALVVSAAVALAAVVVWAYVAHPFPGDPGRLAVFRFGWLRWQLRFLGAAALLALLLPRRRLLPAAVAALVAAELLLVHLPANPPAPRRLAFPENGATRFLGKNLGFDRMAALGLAFLPNLPSLYRLADVRSYNPTTPQGYVRETAPITVAWHGEVPELGNPADPLYRRLGVRFLLAAPEAGCPQPARAAFHDATAWICELPAPRTSLFLAPPPAGGGGVRITAFGPDRVSAWAAAPPAGGSALLASTIYQDGGWHPEVDGVPQPPAHALGPFAAARLTGQRLTGKPRGRPVQRVELVYRPEGHLAGCLLAALALALAAFAWCPVPRI